MLADLLEPIAPDPARTWTASRIASKKQRKSPREQSQSSLDYLVRSCLITSKGKHRRSLPPSRAFISRPWERAVSDAQDSIRCMSTNNLQVRLRQRRLAWWAVVIAVPILWTQITQVAEAQRRRPDFPGVDVQRHLIYKKINGQSLRLDILFP
jgi:hypothetical protein